MAIKVGGTEVVDNNRQLKNIASVDSTTVTALSNAGVGSGGGKFSATADGAIAIGKPVALQSDGTVKQVAETLTELNPITTGTERTIGPTANNPSGAYGNIFYFEGTNKKNVLHVYHANSGDAVRLTASYLQGDNLDDFAVAIQSSQGSGMEGKSVVSAFDPVNKYLLTMWKYSSGIRYRMYKFYEDSGGNTGAYATSTTDVTTYGQVRSSGSTQLSLAYSTTDGHFRLTMINTSSVIKVITMEATGTDSPSLTFKGAANIASNQGNSEDFWMAYNSTDNRFLITYRNGASSDNGTYRYFSTSTSDGSVTNHAGANFYSGGYINYTRCEYNPQDNCFVVCFTYGSGHGIKQLDVSGTSITVVDGASSLFQESTNDPDRRAHLAYDPISRKIILGRRSPSSNNHMNISKINTSGSSPSKTGEITLHTSEVNDAMGVVYLDGQSKMLGVSERSSGDFAYRTFTVASATSTNTNWIGFAEAAISDSASGDILVVGSTAENQSGLTIGSTYYVQADGTLATTSTNAVKAGRAIAANKLLITEGNAA